MLIQCKYNLVWKAQKLKTKTHYKILQIGKILKQF